MAAKSGELLPGLPAVGGAEQGRVLDAGINGIRIGQRRLEMPDALELPGMRRAVVPLVGARNALVGKVVADRLPGLAAVARALDHLAEPAARLGGVDPIGLGGRALEVVDFPAGKMRPADVPRLAFAVRLKNERALPRPH